MKQHTRALGIISAVLIIVLLVGALATRRGGHDAVARDVVKWGYYVYYDDSSKASLEQHVSDLDIVSPYFYHLTPAGTIKSFADESVTQLIQSNGAKVVPLIQNESQFADFHKTMATDTQRDAIVALLVDLVETNGYDGIHIDFEGISQSDRDLLTDFMRRLHLAFQPHGWIVSQAVAARTSDADSYWGGAYDYKALAAYNDYVVVMAYDWGYSGRPDPAPVAPMWWVEDVVSYSKKKLPDDKFLLGIPFYGYDWNTTTGPPASSVSYADAMDLAIRPEAQVGYSNDDQAPWIHYKDDQGDDHEVWFENSASFEAKINLVIDENVGGFATWRLGHEDPSSWYVIQSLSTPAARVPPFDSSADRVYFPETGHSLAYGFLKYWNENGGLERFGYPKTEEFTEYDAMVDASYTVQYFERGRFEYHPEYAGTEFEVLLGHIGRWALGERHIDPWSTATTPKDGSQFFPESGHNAGGVFLDYWNRHGGLMSFGYPISEEMVEVNPEDHHSYVVQYFERARFEYHPEFAGTDHEVLLGLLGNEMLRQRGWVQ
jgi:spore germination protein YaaH